MKNEHKNGHLENAGYGFMTGAIVGGGISAFEFLKVKMQTNLEMTLRSIATREFARNNWKGFVHTVPAFALFFGGACAIEFSVNSAVNEKYGANYALWASAISGAAFLTPADHMMYRKEKGIGYFESLRYFSGRHFPRAFTGLTPMIGREFLFGLSVLYTGPLLGSYIKKQREGSDDPLLDLGWRFIGTLLSAMVTTTASQPLDTLARKMQIKAYESDYKISPNLWDVTQNNLNARTLYRGYMPRLVLASLGAASIGTLFQFFKGVSHQDQLKNTPENVDGKAKGIQREC